MEITEDTLAALVADFPATVKSIRAGLDAYVKIMHLPQVEYDPFGQGFLRWRGTPVYKDNTLGRASVLLEPV